MEPQLAISELAGAVFEAGEDQPSEPAALKRWVDVDPLELRDLVGDMTKRPRRDQASVAYADEELTAVVQVGGRVEGVLPRRATEIRPRVGARQIVERAHSLGVGGLEASHLRQADHTGGRIGGIHD